MSLEIYINGAKAARFVPRLIQGDDYLRKMPTKPFISISWSRRVLALRTGIVDRA